jgi:hypothetical protein
MSLRKKNIEQSITIPCNFGAMSASGLVFILIGFFTLLIVPKILSSFLEHLYMGVFVVLKVDFFSKMTSSSKNSPFWIFE